METVPNQNSLGEYLRARRDQVTPEQAGMPSGRNRRVPGLRREEVASLAGLSVDYYARLEQGREQHPSASVLNALARALRLGPDAQRYLFAIATPGPAGSVNRQIGQNLLDLLEDWTSHPAILLDTCNNVVAANQLGYALFDGHTYDSNLTRFAFLDPGARTFYREWPKMTASSVAGLRASASHDPNDSELMALIGELTVRSEEFGRLWAKAEVREKTSDTCLLHHPVVGDLDLAVETFRPTAALGLLLKVYRPIPGSATGEALALLGSLTADQETGIPLPDKQRRSAG